jgi:formamidopyrimidine-DNA glycosylase
VPELPDVTVYVEALDRHVVGETLEGVRVQSASLLKTFDPPLRETHGKCVLGARRIGKRLVLALEQDLFLVVHLMIAGRLKWRDKGAKIPRKRAHAAFDFTPGTILLTEASTRKRASLHVVRGEPALEPFHRGGLDVFAIAAAAFAERLTSENHTLKRSLTDPRLFDGIGKVLALVEAVRDAPVLEQSPVLGDQVVHHLPVGVGDQESCGPLVLLGKQEHLHAEDEGLAEAVPRDEGYVLVIRF